MKQENDSVCIFVKNELGCPTHVIISNTNLKEAKTYDLKAYEEKLLAKKAFTDFDSVAYIDQFSFSMRYGFSYPLKSYDTLYNYALPFLKGKRYKVLQGQNTNFTHNTPTSKYAIDFKMKEGETVCAMRDGIVVAIKQDSNKGGKSKKYFNDANYVMLYHQDGLFS